MTGGEQPKCNPEDLMCQFQALNLLEGMEKLFGTEKFQEQYPDFKQLGDVVRERMSEQRGNIKEIMERCGLDTVEFEKESASLSEQPAAEPQEEPDGD